MPPMRLRLRIQRNEIPTVSTLWPISDTQFKHTVAQLLEQVNLTFPLESHTWGLEHYAVTVGGFECLHYHELGAVCKDEDEVVIRPLQYAEVRARTVLGRDQITPDGRHLLDGLPFGRPVLRGVLRPDVRIPPMRRQRVQEVQRRLQGPVVSGQDAWALVGGRLGQVVEGDELEEDEDDGADEDFGEEEEELEAEIEESEVSSSDSSSEEDSSEDESDSDTSDTSSTSDSESDDDESMSEASWDGIQSAPPIPPSKKAASKTELGSRMTLSGAPANGHVAKTAAHSSKAAASSQPTKRKATSDAPESEQSEAATKKVKLDVSLPGQGKKETKSRNERKRDGKQLAHLKRVGELPIAADLKTLYEWRHRTNFKSKHSKDFDPEEEVEESEIANGVKLAAVEATHVTAWGADNRLAGLIFTVAGQLPTRSKDGISNLIRQYGGKITGIARKDTDYAVLGADPGLKKMQSIKDHRTKTITEDELLELLQRLPAGGNIHSNSAQNGASTETLDYLPDAELADEDQAATEEQSRASRESQTERKRQELLKALASGGIDVTDKHAKRNLFDEEDEEPPEEFSTKQPTANEDTVLDEVMVDGPSDSPPTAAPTKATDMVPQSVARRSRLDLAGSQRLVFGSLGVRAPKTQQERDTLQKKLAEKAKQKLPPPGVAAAAKPALDVKTAEAVESSTKEEDEESWRAKIDLTAVECCEEGVVLSTPPFPFYQRWDPQQRKKKAKGRVSGAHAAPKKLRKKTKDDDVASGEHVESYDKYNTDGNGDALDYDDVAEEDEYWEEGALLDEGYDEDGEHASPSQQLNGEIKDAAPEDDGFPPLPADTSTLPLLAESDAKALDYITYSELVCSAVTNWQPATLTRTAQLLSKDEDGWNIKLASRDLRTKEYDNEGKRVYKKFEMEGMSEDEDGEEEREKVVPWAEMGEVRLLMRGEGEGGTKGGETEA